VCTGWGRCPARQAGWRCTGSLMHRPVHPTTDSHVVDNGDAAQHCPASTIGRAVALVHDRDDIARSHGSATISGDHRTSGCRNIRQRIDDRDDALHGEPTRVAHTIALVDGQADRRCASASSSTLSHTRIGRSVAGRTRAFSDRSLFARRRARFAKTACCVERSPVDSSESVPH